MRRNGTGLRSGRNNRLTEIVCAGLLSVWLVPVLAACGEAGGPAETHVRQDSAGVSIVENRADTAALREGWSVGSEPTMTIGGGSADESQQMYRVSGGLRLPDGRIVVANSGSAEIRVYGTAGELIATHGRKGGGPGEFDAPALAGRMGDSLIVFDPNPRRVSILTADGGYHRSYEVGTEGGGNPIAQGILPDGSLAIGGGMYFSSDQGGLPDGLIRAVSRYVVIAADGTMRGDLGELPAAELFARRSGNRFSARGVPLGRVTAYVPTGNRVWLGTGDSWEIRGWSPTAQLEVISRFDRPLEPVSDRWRNAAIDEAAEDATDANAERELRASMAEIPSPPHVPPYDIFRGDALGNLWVGEYLLPGRTQRTWTVVNADGIAIGRVTTPERTLPLEIGADYLLGLTRDELGVERITLWPLTRPAA